MPATIEQIYHTLGNQTLDASDRWVIKWQFGILGGFGKALATAITTADETNLANLRLGFPTEVEGYHRWAYGDLGNRLRKLGLNI